MSSRKRSFIYDNLAHLVEAGVPLVRATRTAGATGGGPIARALRGISKDLEAGSTIGEGMRQWPRIFSPLDTMVVEVSDHSGNLPEGLRMLSKWYDLITKIRNTLILGLIWPVLCLHIAAIVFPIPHLAQSNWDFSEYGRSVIGILMCFYIPVITIIAVVKLAGHNSPLRRVLDEIVLVIPVLGGAVRDMAISRYCLAFSMMARAGVSVITTTQRAAELCGNAAMAVHLAGGCEAVKLGNQVVEGFGKGLPLEFIEMWRVGEETGDLAAVAARLAKSYEERMVFKFMMVAQWLPYIIYAAVSLMIVFMIITLLGQIGGFYQGLSNW
jgi:type IV pilus assembly protein PilC